MRTRTVIVAAIVVVLIGAVAAIATYPNWRPISQDDAVKQAFPGLDDAERAAIRALPTDQHDELMAMAQNNHQMAEDVAAALLKPDIDIQDALPDLDAEPLALADGVFAGFDAIFRGQGSATIYQLPNDTWALRLQDFHVTNGPDLHVLLSVNTPDAYNTPLDFGSVDLGSLRGNSGTQVYSIPSDVDLSRFGAVVIWCQPYSVSYAVAEITAG